MLPSSLLATTGLGGAPRPYQRKAKKQSIVQGKQLITIETEQICKAFDQTTALLLQCEKEKKVHSGKDQKAYFTFHVNEDFGGGSISQSSRKSILTIYWKDRY